MAARWLHALPHAVMLVAAAFLYWAAGRIDVDTGGRIGPAAWPRAVIVILAVLCACEIVKRLFLAGTGSAAGLVEGLTRKPADGPAAAPAGEPAASEHRAKLYGGMALVAGYVAAAPWAGFFVATALFLAIFPWIGGYRRPLVNAVLGLAGSLALVVVFMRVAYISLPLGAGPFRAFSIALLQLIGVR